MQKSNFKILYYDILYLQSICTVCNYGKVEEKRGWKFVAA